MEKIKADKNYKNLLGELKSIINRGKGQAYKAVDNIKVQTYWQLGERIVREEMNNQDRAKYEVELIDGLSHDLIIGKSLLYEIVKFYKKYPIFHTVCGKLSWSHYGLLINTNDGQERKFYETKIIVNSWSVRELKRQIKNQLYQKTDSKEMETVFKNTLPAASNIQTIFKPEYNLNFLTIPPSHQEKELESKIVHNITHFLKELGPDFSFLGRQVPIQMDSQKHYIDLVLFHRGIPCVILVDLKVGKLNSRDIGQMNKYITYYRNNMQYASEQETIGLIICKEIGHEEVIYALGDLEEKIFVAKYKIKLPSEAKIKRLIKGL